MLKVARSTQIKLWAPNRVSVDGIWKAGPKATKKLSASFQNGSKRRAGERAPDTRNMLRRHLRKGLLTPRGGMALAQNRLTTLRFRLKYAPPPSLTCTGHFANARQWVLQRADGMQVFSRINEVDHLLVFLYLKSIHTSSQKFWSE